MMKFCASCHAAWLAVCLLSLLIGLLAGQTWGRIAGYEYGKRDGAKEADEQRISEGWINPEYIAQAKRNIAEKKKVKE